MKTRKQWINDCATDVREATEYHASLQSGFSYTLQDGFSDWEAEENTPAWLAQGVADELGVENITF